MLKGPVENTYLNSISWLLPLSIVRTELTEKQREKLESTVLSSDYLQKIKAVATGSFPQGLLPPNKGTSKYYSLQQSSQCVLSALMFSSHLCTS